MKLILPLSVIIPRKTKADRVWILNLNSYRNTHFQILNKAKIEYKEQVFGKAPEPRWGRDIKEVIGEPPYRFIYIIYPGSGRSFDIGNVCSIIDKFTADALQEIGVIANDNYKNIPEIVYKFGEIDKTSPRCELEIISI